MGTPGATHSIAAGRIIARSTGSLTVCADGSAAGEPDLLGRPAPDPLIRELGKVVVGGAWRHLDLDQVLYHQAATGHKADPFPVRQREQPVHGARGATPHQAVQPEQ